MAKRTSYSRRQQRRPTKSIRPRGRRIIKVMALLTGLTLFLGLAGTAAVFVTGWVMYQRAANSLGDINGFLNQNDGGARIYDRNGTLLYEFEDRELGQREPVPLGKISRYLIDATIATEDASYYSNPGVNFRGMIRAGWENLFPGRGGFLEGSGGSSITQQLVKNVLIPEEDRYERSPERKLREAVFAIELTRRYSKDQILEWYLNQINYGNRSYGIGAAAQRYFGVSASDLTLAQAAMLAGIPNSPFYYDPTINYAASKNRQDQVLDLMVRAGKATPEQADNARVEALTFVNRESATSMRAPHWVFYIQDLLIRRYGEAAVYRSGLRVTTTLDLALQEQGTAIVDKWVTEFEGQNCGCHNGALVAIDNRSGQILTMVGSRNFYRKDIQGENNNATAIKQPGSALKPAVYLAAFMKGWTPGTIVYDLPKKYPNPGGEPFVPVGPTSAYVGPTTVRTALGSSLNAPAVAAADFVGVRGVIDAAHKLGISTLTDPENYGVSIATGGANVTLLDMTYLYSTLANNGTMVGESRLEPGPRQLDPIALLKVVDARDRVLYEFREPRREQVVPAQQAYMVTNILSDDSARSLIYQPGIFSMKDGRPIAAKTGTQQGFEVSEIRSTWNFGYVPDLSVGVWVGNTDGTLVRNITSASSSLRVWRDFMQYAIDYLKIPSKQFTQPPGLVRAPVLAPSQDGCRTVDDLFISGQTPANRQAGGCQRVRIDTRNGLLAGPDTPPEFVQEVTYVDLPQGVDGWRPGAGVVTGPPPAAVSTLRPQPTATPSPTAPPDLSPTAQATLPSRVVTPPATRDPNAPPGTAAPTLPPTIPRATGTPPLQATPAVRTPVRITPLPAITPEPPPEDDGE